MGLFKKKKKKKAGLKTKFVLFKNKIGPIEKIENKSIPIKNKIGPIKMIFGPFKNQSIERLNANQSKGLYLIFL